MATDFIPLEKNELKELLNKGWMTHDAMWFLNCMKECGIEQTNKINKAAVRDMAAIEIKRHQKALGVADRYECGISLRIDTWLTTLGIKYEVQPKVTGCMMHTDGKCFRDYKFFFEK
jgi:hypothetical protein